MGKRNSRLKTELNCMGTVRILLVGKRSDREFRESLKWLAAGAELTTADGVDDALAQLSGGASPTAIVVAQTRPGMFSQSQVERLHAAAPLTRFVALLGSWCEGETRTGQPWPGVTRIYWHQATSQLEELLHVNSSGHSVWDMPRTATVAERLLHTTTEPVPPRNGLIAISTETPTAFDALADACRARGYSAVWLAPHQSPRVKGAKVVLCDLERYSNRRLVHLQNLAAEMRPTPLVALLGFPRWEDQQRLLQAGATSIVSKPFLLEDVYRHLDRAVAQQAIRADLPTAA